MPRSSRWVAEFKFANWFQACNMARHILYIHSLLSDDEYNRIKDQTRVLFPEFADTGDNETAKAKH